MHRLKAWIRHWLEVPHTPLIEEDQGNLQGHLIELTSSVERLEETLRAYDSRQRSALTTLRARVAKLETPDEL